ncbi:MAG: proline--tRNA ligase [Thermoproteota archaeon]
MSTRETFNVDKERKFSEWYNRIVREATIIDDRYNVKGFIIYRPWGMIMIKEIYKLYEEELELRGHLPTLFPVVIPEENLQKESEHVKGFTPEVFWVTHGGNEPLEKRLALRPTSETAFYPMYALWIRSVRDLPLKLYQSCSVFRYETKATRPLLRGREFLWIESHDAFPTEKDALEQVKEDMEVTVKVLRELGIPVMFCRRPQWDKFKGAVDTYAADCLMPDGKLNQVASTHYLGRRFSEAFGIYFQDEDGKNKAVYQTCFGPGIGRTLAALISIHGDNSGLVLPFRTAPIQVVIVPIPGGEKVQDFCMSIFKKLKEAGMRVHLDLEERSPGSKYYYWEMMGVPFRLEIGAKECGGGYATVFRRDTRSRTEVQIENLVDWLMEKSEEMLHDLYEKALKRFNSKTKYVATLEEAEEILKIGYEILKAPFCSIEMDGADCGSKVGELLGLEVRGMRLDIEERPSQGAKCIFCGRRATEIVYMAVAY